MKLSEKLGEVIRAERMGRGISLSRAEQIFREKSIDCSNSTLQRIEKGHHASFPIVMGYCQLFGWTLAELDKRLHEDEIREEPAEYDNKPKRKVLPTLGRELPLVRWDNTDMGETRFATGKIPKNAFCMLVSGNSMEIQGKSDHDFPDGCMILVNPDKTENIGDIVVAENKRTNQKTFRKLLIDCGEKMLAPLNPQYPVINVTEDIEIKGVVFRTIIDRRA